MVSDVRYEVCWFEGTSMYSCGCGHRTISDAMGCMTGDARTFIRAVQNGVTRSLDEEELRDFIFALINRAPDRVH